MRGAAAVAHIGFKRQKPAKNKLTWSDFTNFSMQVSAYSDSFRFRSFRALHIQNLSNSCRHKYDPSISQFFQSNFWQVFDVWHNCAEESYMSQAQISYTTHSTVQVSVFLYHEKMGESIFTPPPFSVEVDSTKGKLAQNKTEA